MMRWVGHVACMGKMRYVYKIWVRDVKGRDHSEDVDVNGRIILEWTTGKYLLTYLLTYLLYLLTYSMVQDII
jgi:hypothetical protein